MAARVFAVLTFVVISFGICSGSLPSCKIATDDEEVSDTPSYEALGEALGLMKKAYRIMKQQALDVRKEKEAFESVAKKLEHVNFASTIKLNVGGQYFTTSLQTLKKDPGSTLHGMFSGRFDTKPTKDGSYFIDRDGTHFRYILNYLRTGHLLLPNDKLVRKELLEEAEFYQIREIMDELCPPPFLGSTILSTEQKQFFVNTWLKERLKRHRSTFVLLYRASRDGWTSHDFHAFCDNKGPTVTVVKSGDNIFGGYTEQSWDGSSGSKHCTESFLFSLVNPSGASEPTKLSLKSTSNQNAGIYCSNEYGPTFGNMENMDKESVTIGHNGREFHSNVKHHDLHIASNANVNSNSYSELDITYKCPPLVTPTTFLTGEKNFVVLELEVFVYQE